ncbi:MAG: HAD family hydrolase [Candidatus Latescibacterota bacterium]
MARSLVVLDRDGTLIVERGYLSDPAQVELLPGVASALREMRSMGLGLVVATNQSGVGRGYFAADTVQRVHERLLWLLFAAGAALDACYYCPHVPEAHYRCRKPATGMVEQAARDLGFDPASWLVIGDKPCDILLARNLGATSVLVRTGYGELTERDVTVRPDCVVDDLVSAAQQIRSVHGDRGGRCCS